jgi:hypothetical protein
MNTATPNKGKKSALGVFIVSIILTIVLFFLGRTYGWSHFLLAAEIISAMAMIISFLYAFIKINRQEISITRRRAGVIINYSSLLILLILFYLALGTTINIVIAAVGIVLAGLIIISFIIIFMKTGLWKFVHTKIDQLDEREIQVTHISLRRSYTIFGIISLSLFLVSELIKDYFSGISDISFMPIIGALIYLAHTLPASIIAWTEKEV